MFENNGDKATPSPKGGHRGRLTYGLVGIAALLVVVVLVLGFRLMAAPTYTIPDNIIKEASYPIFVPKSLPAGYKVVDSSFTISEGTLVFRAEDSSGSTIAFTEQKRPQGFNFERFYQGQLENAEKLNGPRYPSVVGKSPTGGKQLLSVVTDETWILASTSAPLSKEDFAAIASGIKKY